MLLRTYIIIFFVVGFTLAAAAILLAYGTGYIDTALPYAPWSLLVLAAGPLLPLAGFGGILMNHAMRRIKERDR